MVQTEVVAHFVRQDRTVGVFAGVKIHTITLAAEVGAIDNDPPHGAGCIGTPGKVAESGETRMGFQIGNVNIHVLRGIVGMLCLHGRFF
jgi:hypothetical protein